MRLRKRPDKKKYYNDKLKVRFLKKNFYLKSILLNTDKIHNNSDNDSSPHAAHQDITKLRTGKYIQANIYRYLRIPSKYWETYKIINEIAINFIF